MPTITLLTDFGVADTYVGQMKGVIHSIAPQAGIVDLSHEVPPQDVLTAAVMLDDAVDAFSSGTIHVAVVDPGVGSRRRTVAIRTPRHTFIGPDNGLFTLVLEREMLTDAVTLTNPRYHRDDVCATFHGRDIFAPVAAHVANGVALSELGEPVDDRLHMLDLPTPEIRQDHIAAHVLLIDRFGNLITDLKQHAFEDWLGRVPAQQVRLEIGTHRITGIGRTFSDVKTGQAIAYFGSSGRLELAVRNDHAARVLDAQPQMTLSLHHA